MAQNFFEVLKRERLNKNLSQEKLAEKSGLSTRYISSLECNDQQPSLEVFIRLAKALELKPSELMQGLD
jgi:transcriptional regulator with XRE-family HTH domain